MTNQKSNSQAEPSNPIDAVLKQDQDGEISRPESPEQGVFEVKADDLPYAPNDSSQEHALDDTHETLTKARFDKSDLLEVAEDAMTKNE